MSLEYSVVRTSLTDKNSQCHTARGTPNQALASGNTMSSPPSRSECLGLTAKATNIIDEKEPHPRTAFVPRSRRPAEERSACRTGAGSVQRRCPGSRAALCGQGGTLPHCARLPWGNRSRLLLSCFSPETAKTVFNGGKRSEKP